MVAQPTAGSREPAPELAGRAEYVRPIEPLVFPSEGEMPESTLHLVLRTFLFELLRFTWGEVAQVGSDQFVYWRASDPKTCLAPDAFVAFGRPFEHFDSWKTWERGTPDVCVEIVSDHDRSESWERKLALYQDLGAREVVRFDPEAREGRRLRIWNRVREDLVERVLKGDSGESFILGLSDSAVYWVLANVDEARLGLRLSRDAEGTDLLPSPREAEARAREAEARAREAAEARVRELEELLNGSKRS